MSLPSRFRLFAFILATLATALVAHAEPIDFNLPSQRADQAVLAFSQKAKVDVLFPSDELRRAQSNEVIGRFEPADALVRLLRDTGFYPRRVGKNKFVVNSVPPPSGSIRGRLLSPDREPAQGVRVMIVSTAQSVTTDASGEFQFQSVAPGPYEIVAQADGYQPLRISDARVDANRTLLLDTQILHAARDLTELEPVVVRGRSGESGYFDRNEKLLPPRSAVGNLDLRRTEDDVLPYTVYDRRQLNRSGVVNLNEFLRRELLDSNPGARAPEEDGNADTFSATSSNLSLRGYSQQETVILVNGRRLPEVLYSGANPQLPDVNFIPMSLVQQVEVLPVSASALYTGNAVGGVINIVLRPDVDASASEVSFTYTNALSQYDAPQTATSILHAQSLLNGRLRVRLNAYLTTTMPPTEAELRYHQNHDDRNVPLEEPLYRATPNVRGANLQPLFGPNTSPVTSVAPGADGKGGLGAFKGREGQRNFTFFDSPGGLASSLVSIDYPYGRKQRRDTYFGSVVYDLFPWLEVGVDATYSQTVANRGYDVLLGNLQLGADNPLNPFGRAVEVSLADTAPALGENYSEARLNYEAAVLGILVKLPADWKIALDSQYAHNVTRYRGIAGVNTDRWQRLVDEGRYNPLRDTQLYAPPVAFYDEALYYRGKRGQFVTLGDYEAIDIALRGTNEALKLPTGISAVNVGADYRLNRLAPFRDERRFADGSLAVDPIAWSGRTLERYSVFGELQAPLLPATWLPRGIHALETDLAVRYVGAASSRESNVAPTFGLKIDFAGGVAFRGSITTSNRLPTPYMSRSIVIASGAPGGGGVDLVSVFDPSRNEKYGVQQSDAFNPFVRPESAVTQTGGVMIQRGKAHRWRAALDFVDTRKTDELVVLAPQTVVDLESLWPDRVRRDPVAPSDNAAVGRINTLYTGITNLAWRHSQNWNLSLNYAWTECFGGTLEAYSRLVYFQKYEVQTLPNSPAVDELRHPDSVAPTLLRIRSNFGASWNQRAYGFGWDGHYFHSRRIPEKEWTLQGSPQIDPFWQFDVYAQTDLQQWLPWKNSRYGLRAQLRVNNIFGAQFPKYAADASAAGVEPYGDWRGRVYSVTVTATF